MTPFSSREDNIYKYFCNTEIMIKVVNAIHIEEKQLLFVLKNDLWILPGGIPNEGESSIECLVRKVGEELPGTIIDFPILYKKFTGRSSHNHHDIETEVYFVRAQYAGKHGSRISSSKLFSYQEIKAIIVPPFTKNIIEDLRAYQKL
jgi:ADP-ribose pyrophosphatase YjhB (NUDIX family)